MAILVFAPQKYSPENLTLFTNPSKTFKIRVKKNGVGPDKSDVFEFPDKHPNQLWPENQITSAKINNRNGNGCSTLGTSAYFVFILVS